MLWLFQRTDKNASTYATKQCWHTLKTFLAAS